MKLAYRVSRIRFWLYLGGTYMTGYIIGATNLNQFTNTSFLVQLLYFIIPANILLYGINDLADQDTDQYNTKKEDKEGRIENKEGEIDLKIILLIITAISALIFLIQTDWISRILFILFYFLSFAYSYPPLRFKARPILDFSSNILYALPGILGYYQVSGNLPPFGIWIALFLWTGAMHLFSAVPDIEADRKAGVTTSAVKFGANVSLWICTIFWFAFIFIAVVGYNAFVPFSYIGFLYPLIPFSLIIKPDLNIERIYWYYPYINGFLGLSLSILAGWPFIKEIISAL